MITPEIKDLILSDLVAEPSMEREPNVKLEAQKHGITSTEYLAILRQFHKLDLIILDSTCDGYFFTITADAHDFHCRRGFAGQEMLLKVNIEKLGLEIDKLSKGLTPNQLEIAEKITSIGSAIMSALKFFG